MHDGQAASRAVISSVAEDAPVQQQALQRGDIVTAVDGVDVGSYNEFKAQLDKHVAAEQTSVTLTVSRDGQSVQVPQYCMRARTRLEIRCLSWA